MRWPWGRRGPSSELLEALHAISRGHDDLFAAQQLTAEAKVVAADLRESHRINHFGAALEASMRKNKRT